MWSGIVRELTFLLVLNPEQFLICSSFSRENDYPLLINTHHATHQQAISKCSFFCIMVFQFKKYPKLAKHFQLIVTSQAPKMNFWFHRILSNPLKFFCFFFPRFLGPGLQDVFSWARIVCSIFRRQTLKTARDLGKSRAEMIGWNVGWNHGMENPESPKFPCEKKNNIPFWTSRTSTIEELFFCNVVMFFFSAMTSNLLGQWAEDDGSGCLHPHSS